ncbi:transcriptional regulator FtrA [Falsiroseomonas oryziterrae]|uniref:transcriptional regulator FtrA n=1 Tax=Falsiroseomonas oryziterrae TaxID=2911368 RepID=UPI001F017C7A|nr:transcriptional regulator FtrA [Roseomonas sp. NPKOSM-4]
MPEIRRIVPDGPANPLVAVLAYDGLCTFEFGCAVEVFGLKRPEMGPRWYRYAVASVDPGPIRAAGGLTVVADGGLEVLDRAGTIIVPGWRGVDAPVPEPLRDALRIAHARGARILSLCSGAFVLAAAGLLDGRRATTHWRYHAALAARHPRIRLVPDVLYVDEGSVLTAAGSAAGLDLMLHLVRRDFGPEAANSVAHRLVLPAHRAGAQVQRLLRPVPPERGSGARLATVLDEVRRRLDEPWDVARLAHAAATSRRGLHRRFREATGMSPGDWLIAERLRRAQELLQASRLPVEEVAAAVGFGSAATLRLHCRARLGATPRDLREGGLRVPAA